MTPDSGSPISTLLVSGSQTGRDFLRALLDPGLFTPIVCPDSAAQARELLRREPFDLVLINPPLSDEDGTAFAVQTVQNTVCGVILFVPESAYDETARKMIPYGVLTVSRTGSRASFLQAVRLGAAAVMRLKGLASRASSLKEQMEEGRLVSRAKLLLIEQLRMSEAAAHRYIEKQAMDRCVRRRVIAEDIIRTYSH